MAIYLISYDIIEKNRDEEPAVLEKLKKMKAVRCLYSEWLYESASDALVIAEAVATALSEGDRLLVLQISNSAYGDLLNQQASVALLKRV
jgi:hypothetical protein